MNLEQILDKKQISEIDRVTAFIFEAIDRLHNEGAELEDMKEIKSKVNSVWRKNFPLEDIKTCNTGRKS